MALQGEPDSADYHSKLWIGTDQVGEISSMAPQGPSDYALKGWLLPAVQTNEVSTNAAWVSGDQAVLKTRVAGLAADANAMEINGQVTPAQTLPDRRHGRHPAARARRDAAARGPDHAVPVRGQRHAGPGLLDALVPALQAAQTTHNTVLLQGFGSAQAGDGSDRRSADLG